jgi:hypothetical protein
MDLREIGWGDVDWMHLGRIGNQWRALLNTVMKFMDPKKGGEFLDWLSDY